MPPQNSTLIDNNFAGFPSSLELRHCSPILRPNTEWNIKSNSNQESIGALTQKDKEIQIWIDDKPYYIAGVTSRTTCNDIIKGLIDENLTSGKSAYSLDGKAKSRVYNDYVITECWRGVERSYEGNMTILPVWKAWSRVHNEIRFSLKRRSQLDLHCKQKVPSRHFMKSIGKYISKFLKFLKLKKAKSTERIHTNNDSNELFFVILPDKQYNNQTVAKRPAVHRIPQRLFELSEKPKRRRKKLKGLCTPPQILKPQHNYITKRCDMPLRNLIRAQITEIDKLFTKETHLQKELFLKCRQFKQQNEFYTNPDQQLEISIGQLQNSIENYAQEILKTEQELLEIKNEIKQDISIINNLKRLTLQPSRIIYEAGNPGNQTTCTENLQFVDNIYEFSDNNESFIV